MAPEAGAKCSTEILDLVRMIACEIINKKSTPGKLLILTEQETIAETRL